MLYTIGQKQITKLLDNYVQSVLKRMYVYTATICLTVVIDVSIFFIFNFKDISSSEINNTPKPRSEPLEPYVRIRPIYIYTYVSFTNLPTTTSGQCSPLTDGIIAYIWYCIVIKSVSVARRRAIIMLWIRKTTVIYCGPTLYIILLIKM